MPISEPFRGSSHHRTIGFRLLERKNVSTYSQTLLTKDDQIPIAAPIGCFRFLICAGKNHGFCNDSLQAGIPKHDGRAITLWLLAQ